MSNLVLLMALGCACLQQLPTVPLSATQSLALGLCVAACMAALAWAMRHHAVKRRYLACLLWPLACVLGFAYAAWRADVRLADRLDPALEGQDIEVTGTIASLPQPIDRGIRFDFAVDQPGNIPPRISLAWYRQGMRDEAQRSTMQVPDLVPGERWQLTVRLKRPHGSLNPHGFDFEAWQFERGILASGYVRPKATQLKLAEAEGYWVERARAALRARFVQVLGDAPFAGVLQALALGDQQAVPKAQWDLFAQTGITHLMSISGLHVTMLAGLVYACVSWGWRRLGRAPLFCPAQQVGMLAGALAAWAYCLLAGFGVPAQRTLYMLMVVMAALWLRRRVAARDVLSLALAVVLIIDPWAVLSAGFWLSFGAVALLFYVGSGHVGQLHWLRQWWQAQWALTLAMIPMLLALFQQFSLVSPLANAIAIPLISFVVTPLALLACVPGLDFLLLPAHSLLSGLMAVLSIFASWPYAQWQQASPPLVLVIFAMLGMVWLCLPRGWPARWIGLLPLLLMLVWPAPRPAPGEFWLTTLDVGQGLAVHVQTAEHDLLFDTGPAYSEESNSGNRIVLPYLRAEGVTMLDGLVLTHADNDHSGGAESVVEGVPVGWLLSSIPLEHVLSGLPVSHQPCQAGMRWTWEGVNFELLHPAAADYETSSKSNDMSCVLRVHSAHGSALLTADIEAKTERALLARAPEQLRSDVMLVPHHGSRSSSTAAFVEAVAPQYAIFPVGYRNHYRHPHPDIWQRYVASVPHLLRTDRDGAVRVRYSAAGIQIETERNRRPRYWHTPVAVGVAN